MRAPQPFPFDRLLRLPGAALGPLRAVARASRVPAGWSAALDALRAVLAVDVHVGVVDVRWADAHALPALPDALVALRVELASGVSIVELEPTTALALVDLALGTGADADPVAFRPLGDAELGVLAYLAARFVLAAQPRSGRVLGWTTDPRALAAELRGEPRVVVGLDLTLGGRVRGARLWLPARATVEPRGPSDLTGLADVRVRVCWQAGTVALGAAELAGLRAGDVVLLDTAAVRPAGAALQGHVGLRVAGARTPWFTGAIAEGRSVRLESVSIDKEMVPMAQQETSGGAPPLGDLAAEIPVEVAVELGRQTLTVGVLSRLAPGEVVVMERAPTDPVTLTAGDRVLAHGELVVVDGRVGVRILDVARR